MHSKYSRDFRNFKNRTVFRRLVVKYSIETTENWFGHVRVFLAAIASTESVAKQHFTRQKDILIRNKRARAHTHKLYILSYMYFSPIRAHVVQQSALKYIHINIILFSYSYTQQHNVIYKWLPIYRGHKSDAMMF